MNKRWVLKKDDGTVAYAVLRGDAPEKDELERLFGIEKGYGLTAERWGDEVRIINYYRADTVAALPVLSVTDTEEEPLYTLTPINE